MGSWLVGPLDFDALQPSDVGRTVIYRDGLHQDNPNKGTAEAGVITSWRDGIVFARYSRGDTAAGAKASDLVFGIRPLDTTDEIMAAVRQERG